MSSDDDDWTRLPSPNCWRLPFTTVPDPTICVGATARFDAITSANSARLFLKPVVPTLARLCEIDAMSTCEAFRPESEV